MWDPQQLRAFWEERAQRHENPCHYLNRWKDRYAADVRLAVLRPSDFAGARTIVDIGCGVGDYTAAVAALAPHARCIGFDYPFHVEIARARHASDRLEFREGIVPNADIAQTLASSDAAVMTTSYQCMEMDHRDELVACFSRMRPGAEVIVLDYITDVVPPYQKGLGYKEVEPFDQLVGRFQRFGLRLIEKRDVNFVDTIVFWYLGAHAVSYVLSHGADRVMAALGSQQSKYKLLRFRNGA
jgi:SAM-dependent methyltransferase